MVRHAVETMVSATDQQPPAEDPSIEEPADGIQSAIEPVDILVFAIRDVTYGIPVEIVETVAAGLHVHPVPTSSTSLIGVVGFRDALTEVHDGGVVLQDSPLDDEHTGSMLAVPRGSSRVLITVTSVSGLSPASASEWSPPPASAPPWVSALAWSDTQVVTVIDPRPLDI